VTMSWLFLARFLSRLIKLLSDFMILFLDANTAGAPSQLFYEHSERADPEKRDGADNFPEKPQQHRPNLPLHRLAHLVQ